MNRNLESNTGLALATTDLGTQSASQSPSHLICLHYHQAFYMEFDVNRQEKNFVHGRYPREGVQVEEWIYIMNGGVLNFLISLFAFSCLDNFLSFFFFITILSTCFDTLYYFIFSEIIIRLSSVLSCFVDCLTIQFCSTIIHSCNCLFCQFYIVIYAIIIPHVIEQPTAYTEPPTLSALILSVCLTRQKLNLRLPSRVTEPSRAVRCGYF